MCKCNICYRNKTNCSDKCQWCSSYPSTIPNCLPTPCVTGCIDNPLTTCVETPVDIPDLNLLRGAKLDSIINALILLIQNGNSLQAESFAFKTMSISQESQNADRINTIDSEIIDIDSKLINQNSIIESLDSKVDNLNTLDNLKVQDSEIKLTIVDNTLIATLNMDLFIDKFISAIKESVINTSKFKQLQVYTTDPDNFSLAPYEVSGVPSRTTITVKWTDMGENMIYTVHYKEHNSNIFKELNSTANLGITIPGLSIDTEYDIYVSSMNSAGKLSAPSEIITIKTLL